MPLLEEAFRCASFSYPAVRAAVVELTNQRPIIHASRCQHGKISSETRRCW